MASQVVVGLSLLCALTMTSIVAWREFAGGETMKMPSRVLVSHTVPEWEDLLRGGRRLGDANAPIVIVEFADFECPYCRTFALDDLPALMAEYPDQLQLIYRHFPLPYHRFARPSAVAAECAGRQGRFPQMYAQLYRHQDSLGLITFEALAGRGGVADIEGFSSCLQDPAVTRIVDSDAALGERINVSFTPMIAVNGDGFNRPPTRSELRTLIDSILGR